MCFICNPEVANEELSGDQWLDIMKQARDAGMGFALLTGGEPLLHRDFWQIYTGLRKLGVYITVNSNGTTITPEIADRFQKIPPVRFAISVYGASPEAYEKVTGSAAGYEKLVRGLALLRERGIDFRLRTILSKDTAPDIVNIVNFILSYDVPFGYGNYLMPPVWENGNDPKSKRLSGQEIAEYTKIIRDAVHDYYKSRHIECGCEHGGEHGEAAAQEEQPKDPKLMEFRIRANKIVSKTAFNCNAGLSTFTVGHDGMLKICEIALDTLIDLKQIKFAEGFEQLKAAVDAIKECDECIGCPDKHKCAPCPPRHHLETGSYNKKADYVCEYVRAGVKLME